jgi:hypothetical protein
MISRPLKWVSLPEVWTSEVGRSEEMIESLDPYLCKEACTGAWTLLRDQITTKGLGFSEGGVRLEGSGWT